MQRRNYSSSSHHYPPNRLLTSTEYNKSTSETILKLFSSRETTCGELTLANIDKVVTLVGWMDQKRHGRFLQVRVKITHS